VSLALLLPVCGALRGSPHVGYICPTSGWLSQVLFAAAMAALAGHGPEKGLVLHHSCCGVVGSCRCAGASVWCPLVLWAMCCQWLSSCNTAVVWVCWVIRLVVWPAGAWSPGFLCGQCFSHQQTAVFVASRAVYALVLLATVLSGLVGCSGWCIS
jgi:hypothetical protein